MLTKLKERFRSLIAAEAELAQYLGLSPNHISGIGIALTVLSALVYWNWRAHQLYLILAPTLLLASGFCDALDGALARMSGQITDFGGFLDSLLDRYADAIVLGGIIVGGLCELLWGLAALVGSLLVSYARTRAEASGVEMETVGAAERAERLILLAIASFLSVAWREALGWGVIILAVLTNLTVLQRAIYFHKACHQKKG